MSSTSPKTMSSTTSPMKWQDCSLSVATTDTDASTGSSYERQISGGSFQVIALDSDGYSYDGTDYTPSSTPLGRPVPDDSWKSGAGLYPADMIVRNTFLDFSVDDTLPAPRRRARSLPPPRGLQDRQCSRETSISNIGAGGPYELVHFLAARESHSKRPQDSNALAELCHSEDSEQLPSAGSSWHAKGQCRPCGFFWKSGGCTNGKECFFCHVCDNKEKKRRQKAKKAFFKAQSTP